MRSALVLTCILALACPILAAKKPKDKPKPPTPSTSASQFAGQASQVISFSVTITPLVNQGGATNTDAERMEACGTIMHHLEVAFAMRNGDAQVPGVIFSRERGERENNPHLQGQYDIVTTAHTDPELRALQVAEKRWLKDELAAANTLGMRVVYKRTKPSQRAYVYGYVQKDQGQAHYISFSHGFSAAELIDAVNIYRAEAGKNAFSSKKMNKAPRSETKQISFTVGNLFIMCAWFIEQHKLTPLAPILTPAIVVAYALATTRYRIDESLVTGKNGGNVLDPVRAQAMFTLNNANKNTTEAQLIPLVETVLFGGPLRHNETMNKDCHCSTARLAGTYSLEDAKLAAKRLDRATTNTGPRAPNGGRFIVIDFLHSRQAREAADVMELAGLTRATLFSADQLPNACGYLAAGWACDLRHLGENFADMSMETARIVNTAMFIETQNFIRDRADLADQAEWLTGDEVLAMASQNNPDGAGTAPAWLSGPGPMNFWRIHFARTLTDVRDQGRVHIMVVNTVDATADLAHATLASTPGEHWFLVAWFVTPADDEDA